MQPSLFAEFPRTVLDLGYTPDPQEKILPLVPGFRATSRDQTALSRHGPMASKLTGLWDTVLSLVVIQSLAHFVIPKPGSSDNRVCITKTNLPKGLLGLQGV